ncbi:type VII secretion protein EccE [Actinoplanes sp. NBRC 101535]|uniref:type VII secretion protein EccE n=1 Tax=Actinoplanes sp. NBRC 101535 TaxID=3032196 RepID=UPI002552D997|nr:type VII secretion protein EccE [Actinoplanes sp. NBRC 101535]
MNGDGDFRTAVAMTMAGTRAARAGAGVLFGVRVKQLVTLEAVVALLLVGLPPGRVVLALMVGVSMAGLALAPGGPRLTGLVSFLLRRRRTMIREPAGLLRLVAPGTTVITAELPTGTVALLAGPEGLTALVELDGPCPGLDALAPPGERPLVTTQLVLTGVPGPSPLSGRGPAGDSYRRLTGGGVPFHHRAVLAIRVVRTNDRSEQEAHRFLLGLLRRLSRHAGARPLDEAGLLRTLAELARVDDFPAAGRETWTHLHLGKSVHATFRCRAADAEVQAQALSLPSVTTTVSLTTGAEALVRIAAPTVGMLESAAQRLAERVETVRWDGSHRQGFAATLPLGFSPGADGAGARFRVVAGAGSRIGVAEVSRPDAGLVVGRNRHGRPALAEVFRPVPTRVLLVGGIACAQLLVFRALAVGARVLVRTDRPARWEPFVLGTATTPGSLVLSPPERAFTITPGSALRPILIVQDTGRAAPPITGWQTVLTVREAVGAADLHAAAESDLLLLQPLRENEAVLLGDRLRLGGTASLLTRITSGMVAVIGRRSVRWVALSPTSVEKVLIGPVDRPAAR